MSVKTKPTVLDVFPCFGLHLGIVLKPHPDRRHANEYFANSLVLLSLPPSLHLKDLPVDYHLVAGVIYHFAGCPPCRLPPASFVLIEFISAPLGPCCLNLGRWLRRSVERAALWVIHCSASRCGHPGAELSTAEVLTQVSLLACLGSVESEVEVLRIRRLILKLCVTIKPAVTPV